MNNMNVCNTCSEHLGNMPCSKDKQAMLNELRAEDFVVYETALYLNVYPNDKDAIDYFKRHKDTAARLRHDYEALFGPLTISSVSSEGWSWINCPWPWEKEAN